MTNDALDHDHAAHRGIEGDRARVADLVDVRGHARGADPDHETEDPADLGHAVCIQYRVLGAINTSIDRKRKSRSRSGSRDRKRQKHSEPSGTVAKSEPAKKVSKLDELLKQAEEKAKKLAEEKKAKKALVNRRK